MYVTLKWNNKMTSSVCLVSIIAIFLAINLFFVKSNEVSIDTEVEYIDLPIIMYHGLLKDKKRLNQYVISVDTFEKDLKYLKEKGYKTIFMKDLIDYVYEGACLPEKPIIITFDDGYYNNYLYAYNLEKKYEIKIVISPIGLYTDKYSEIDDKNPLYAHITWDNINDMVESGYVEFQNHSYNMHSNKKGRNGSKKKCKESVKEYKKFFSNDVMKMQNLMKEHIGISPTTFTYPFGAISKESVDILKELGFKATLTSEQKMNKIYKHTDDLYGLYRFLRPNGISTKEYFEKIGCK